jgi:microcystin-dependent protein
MGTPYLGEIRMVAFPFAPKGWAMCNGQSMPINQNQALFSLLGTMYGGNGTTNFLLPDFRGRTSIGTGQQQNTPPFAQGQIGGEEMHILSVAEIPAHAHLPIASSATNTLGSPKGNFWASGPLQYSTSAINTGMAGNAIGIAGSGTGHENRSPYLVINFIIALQGVFPTRN